MPVQGSTGDCKDIVSQILSICLLLVCTLLYGDSREHKKETMETRQEEETRAGKTLAIQNEFCRLIAVRTKTEVLRVARFEFQQAADSDKRLFWQGVYRAALDYGN